MNVENYIVKKCYVFNCWTYNYSLEWKETWNLMYSIKILKSTAEQKIVKWNEGRLIEGRGGARKLQNIKLTHIFNCLRVKTIMFVYFQLFKMCKHKWMVMTSDLSPTNANFNDYVQFWRWKTGTATAATQLPPKKFNRSSRMYDVRVTNTFLKLHWNFTLNHGFRYID